MSAGERVAGLALRKLGRIPVNGSQRTARAQPGLAGSRGSPPRDVQLNTRGDGVAPDRCPGAARAASSAHRLHELNGF